MIAATGPHLHDALPGILCLVFVALIAAFTGYAHLRRWARRTLARHQPGPEPAQPVIQPRETVPYDAAQSPVLVDTEGTPE